MRCSAVAVLFCFALVALARAQNVPPPPLQPCPDSCSFFSEAPEASAFWPAATAVAMDGRHAALEGPATAYGAAFVAYDWSAVTAFVAPVQAARQAVVSAVISETAASGALYTVYLNGAELCALNTTQPQAAYNATLGATNPTAFTLYCGPSSDVEEEGSYGGEPLSFAFVRRGEPLLGETHLYGVVVQPGEPAPQQPYRAPSQQRRIEYVGDSVVAGYGVLGTTADCPFTIATEDIQYTYTQLASDVMAADFHVEAWSGKGVVRNYGWPNATSPDPFPVYWNRSLGNRELPLWDFSIWQPQLVVVHIGGNDYTTQPNPPNATFVAGYEQMLRHILESYAGYDIALGQPTYPSLIHICGPMTLDPCPQLNASLHAIAAEYAPYINVGLVDARHILVSPQDVGCAGHPNWIGHQMVAKLLVPVIQQVMNWW